MKKERVFSGWFYNALGMMMGAAFHDQPVLLPDQISRTSHDGYIEWFKKEKWKKREPVWFE